MTYRDQYLVINEGITISGKIYQETFGGHRNHSQTIELLFDFLSTDISALIEENFTSAHGMILRADHKMRGSYRRNNVRMFVDTPEPYLAKVDGRLLSFLWNQMWCRSISDSCRWNASDWWPTIHLLSSVDIHQARFNEQSPHDEYEYPVAIIKESEKKIRVVLAKALELVQTDEIRFHLSIDRDQLEIHYLEYIELLKDGIK